MGKQLAQGHTVQLLHIQKKKKRLLVLCPMRNIGIFEQCRLQILTELMVSGTSCLSYFVCSTQVTSASLTLFSNSVQFLSITSSEHNIFFFHLHPLVNLSLFFLSLFQFRPVYLGKLASLNKTKPIGHMYPQIFEVLKF